MTDNEFNALLSDLRTRDNWSNQSEEEIVACRRKGFNFNCLIDQPYSARQMHQLYLGLVQGVDISKYADVEISAKEMKSIRESLPIVFRAQTQVELDTEQIENTTETPVPDSQPVKIQTKTVLVLKKPDLLPDPVPVSSQQDVIAVDQTKEEPLAKLAKSENGKEMEEDPYVLVPVDNPIRWNDIEIRESDLIGLTLEGFCKRAGLSGADGVYICKADFLSLKTAKAGITISVSVRIRNRSFVLLADVVEKESLDAAQMEQICRARDAGLPFQLLIGFDASQMHEIRMGLMSLDRWTVEMYAKEHFSAREMRYLRWAISLGYEPKEGASMADASKYVLDKQTEDLPFFPLSAFRGEYDEEQISLFSRMWKDGFREVIPALARMHLDEDQLFQVLDGLRVSRLAMSYAHPEFSAKQMQEMKEELCRKVSYKERLQRKIELEKQKKEQQKQVKELQLFQAK